MSESCCGVSKGKYLLGFVVVVLLALLAYQWVTSGGGAESSPSNTQTMEADTGLLEVIEYSDFMCPYCGRAAQTIGQIKEEYAGKVAVAYKHYPLSFHKGSDKAAEASECARDQGLFWEYHDKLFEGYTRGRSIGDATVLENIASELGLDEDVFSECLDSGSKEELVKQHIEEANELGVQGTPTFFVGDNKIVGAQPIEIFRQVIDEELSKRDG